MYFEQEKINEKSGMFMKRRNILDKRDEFVPFVVPLWFFSILTTFMCTKSAQCQYFCT